MDTRKTIKIRREELGMTMKDLSLKVGVSEGTISRWESGNIQNMRIDKIVALAKALRISPSLIMGWDDEKDKENVKTQTVRRIPVLGHVSAGVPIEMIDDVIGYTLYDKDPDGDYFGLLIRGDSMEPYMYNGDVVIVHPQPDVESGEIAVVAVNGSEATCKRLLKYKEGISLIFLNSRYSPMSLTNKEMEDNSVTVLGKVVELKRRVN